MPESAEEKAIREAAELAAEQERLASETDEQKAERLAAEAEAAAEVQLIAIGSEPTPGEDEGEDDELIEGKPAPPWVKALREKAKDDARKLRELEAENLKLKAPAPSAPPLIVVGEKPTMESCGFDAEEFEAELDAWKVRKTKAEDQEKATAATAKEAADAWNAKQARYADERGKLKIPDAKEAETAALAVLTPIQQGIILGGAKNPALLTVALGKTPEKLKELAAIKDPVEFAWAACRIEMEIKTKMVKPGAKPESRVNGNAPVTATVDSKLESLRKEAARTGDFTQVAKYKREVEAARQRST